MTQEDYPLPDLETLLLKDQRKRYSPTPRTIPWRAKKLS